jgi:hypothetical protein
VFLLLHAHDGGGGSERDDQGGKDESESFAHKLRFDRRGREMTINAETAELAEHCHALLGVSRALRRSSVYQ